MGVNREECGAVTDAAATADASAVADVAAIADAAAARVDSWLTTLLEEPDQLSELKGIDRGERSARADLLEGSRQESDGFAFTRRLLEAVMSVSDPFSAAVNLREVSRALPETMPAVDRLAVRAGGLASLGLPWAVLPVARKWLRERVSHLVLSAKIPDDLPARTVIAPIGTQVVGDQGAERELQRLLTLAALPAVTVLAVDVSRLVPETGSGMWSLDRDAEVGAVRLQALLKEAQRHDTAVVLESSDYRSSLLAPHLLAAAISPASKVRVGVSLPAEFPESLQAAEALVSLSRARVEAGGEPIEISVGVTGATGPEQISSILSGLAVPAIDGLTEQHAHQLRVLSRLLAAGSTVRTVVASEDPFLLTAATLLAERAGQAQSLTVQLRAGTAPTLESAIGEHGFAVRRRLPVAHSGEFSGAAEYLIRLAAETADAESALARTRALLGGDVAERAAGAERIRSTLALAVGTAPASRRLQHRDLEWSEEGRDTAAFYRPPTEAHAFDTGGLTAAVLGLTRAHTGAITVEFTGAPLRIPAISDTGFANEPDTDASRFDNREWVREMLRRAARSDVGVTEAGAAEVGGDIEHLFGPAVAAGSAWRELRPSQRGTHVGRLALAMASARDRLIEVLAAESGAPISQIDPQNNGSIDAARYLSQLAGGLGTVRGAQFVPDPLTAVVFDEGTPLDERVEAILAPLATGSAVLVVAHPSVARSTAIAIEEWRATGLPEHVVQLAVAQFSDIHLSDSHPGDIHLSDSHPSDGPRTAHLDLAARVTADPRVDRAIVLGHRETAALLVRRRPDLRVEGRFRVQGVTVITPSADPALAARHAVHSAFGATHADTGIARAVVLLGTASRSEELREALRDAVASIRVGDTVREGGAAREGESDPLALTLGPLPALPGEPALRALTELGPGEEWLVEPECLDEEGLLWKPGIRTGIARDASFWREALGAPVIGLITAHSIDDAISLTNRIGGGAVAAIHSNDPQETLPWLERARAASLFVGRSTVPARVERQPLGGWGAAGSGASVLAGGPHRLQSLGTWRLREGTASPTLHLRGLTPEVQLLIEISQRFLDYQSFDRVRRAALSDALTWRTSFGRADDVTGLGIERNLLRHWPVETHVRAAENAELADVVRVLAASFVAGASISLSTGIVLPAEITDYLSAQGVTVSLERDDAWLERVSVNGPGDGSTSATRIRLIGGDRVRTAEWLSSQRDVLLTGEAVTMAGPIELLAFVREQSISVTAHRHGLALLPAGVGGWIAELQGREGREGRADRE